MKKFRLPRKVKKAFKKGNPFFKCHYNQADYNWFKNKDQVSANAMRFIIKYPEVATWEELLEWSISINNKRFIQICKERIQ